VGVTRKALPLVWHGRQRLGTPNFGAKVAETRPLRATALNGTSLAARNCTLADGAPPRHRFDYDFWTEEIQDRSAER